MPRISVIVASVILGCSATVSPPTAPRSDGGADGAADASVTVRVDAANPACTADDPTCSDLVDPGDRIVWVDQDIPDDRLNSLSENNRTRYGVRLRPYRIGRYEVTNAAYQRCLDAGACPPWPRVDERNEPAWVTDYRSSPEYRLHPAVFIYAAADAVCRFYGGHLPTRAQYQFASDAGRDQRFPWGDEFACVGNFDVIVQALSNGARFECTRPLLRQPRTRVDSHPDARGPFGTHHLKGNVFEYLALLTQAPEDFAALNRRGEFPLETLREFRPPERIELTGGYWTYVTENRVGVVRRIESVDRVTSTTSGARCVWEVATP